MSIDAERLDEKLEACAISRLSVDTKDIAGTSEPSSVASSPSSSPFIELDILPSQVTRSQSEIYGVSDSVTPSTTASSSSLPTSATTPTMNVKFAPLPALAPRKRRSNQPLGMAARAQLVRRRRALQMQEPEIIQQDGEDMIVLTNSIWTSPQFEEQRRRVEILAARHAQIQANNAAMEVIDILNQPDDDEKPLKKRSAGGTTAEEPVSSLGKKVKGAGITLWKRVSSKEVMSAKIKEDEMEKARSNKLVEQKRLRRKSDPEQPKAPILRRSCSPSPLPPLRPILTRVKTDPSIGSSLLNTPIQTSLELQSRTILEEPRGRVWEEEVGNTFERSPQQNEVDDASTILALPPDYDPPTLDPLPLDPQQSTLESAPAPNPEPEPSRPSPPLPELPEKASNDVEP